jgi:hypothetical protein
MVLRISTTKIVSRSIEPVENISPEVTFIALDTFMETSRKDEFIFGNLFDYNGGKINYVWDAKKHQVASLTGKNLNTELIIAASEFLKTLYRRPDQKVDVKELSVQIVDSLKEFAVPRPLKKMEILQESNEELDFINDYESDSTEPVFAGEFLGDDEEVDDFDEQLAIKSQEFLKEHPELKSEMEIVRLLEGN